MTTLVCGAPTKFVNFRAINDECLPPGSRPSAIAGAQLTAEKHLHLLASRCQESGQPGGHRASIEQVAATQSSADTALAGKGAADYVSVAAAQQVV
jgi:hypothetical protein